MLDIKRLHKVHYKYPNNLQGEGKSTYGYDSLLRYAQTGYYKNLCYVKDNYKASQFALNDFMNFLTDQGERFTMSFKGTVELYGVHITFRAIREIKPRRDEYILDLKKQKNVHLQKQTI